jgi:hypothetical protein
LAILGLFCCWLFGVLAVIRGSSDLYAMHEGRMDSSGFGLTLAGVIIGCLPFVMMPFYFLVRIVLNPQ